MPTKTTLTRREFLKASTTSLTAWTVAPTINGLLPRLAFVDPKNGAQGDILLVVFQRGGMDALNAVIPHGATEYYNARPTIAIPEPDLGNPEAGIDLDGYFGLHPALAPLKEIWEDKALAIVHACGSPDPTHSHFDAMDYMERGTPGEKSLASGWLARHLQTAAWDNNSPLRAVGFGSMLQGSLRGPVPATVLKSITDFHLGGRTDIAELAEFQTTLSQLYSLGGGLDPAANLTFQTSDTLSQIISETYVPGNNVTYPDTEFGQSLQQVAQLIRAGVGLEIAAVDIGGWDTHAEQGAQEGQMPTLLSEMAQGLAAFYEDMADEMKKITVVTMSEFGRRLEENASGGTDHGHGGAMFLMGGNINGGKVYGDWPGLTPEFLYGPGDLAISTDFRDILGEIVQKRLHNDQLENVFPNYKEWNFRGIATE